MDSKKSRRTFLIYQTVVALAFLAFSLLWSIHRGKSLPEFVDSIAGSLGGVAIGAAAAWLIWALAERDPDIPEEFGFMSMREIRRQSYFARGFTLSLLATERKLALEMTALVVPVTTPASCRVFGASDLHWKGKLALDYWKLGTCDPVATPGQRRGERVATESAEPMTYAYVFEFEEEPQVIEDDHVFTFFCDSVRVEALLTGSRRLEVSKGDEVLRVSHQTATHAGFVKWVCVAPGPWGPKDSFRWRITEA